MSQFPQRNLLRGDVSAAKTSGPLRRTGWICVGIAAVGSFLSLLQFGMADTGNEIWSVLFLSVARVASVSGAVIGGTLVYRGEKRLGSWMLGSSLLLPLLSYLIQSLFL